jgi:ABC-type branched-subunit amino acid transport system substrate-binding protein
LPSRCRAVCESASVQNVDFDGVMGKVGFDANGDAVSQTVTVYRLSGGTWKPV